MLSYEEAGNVLDEIAEQLPEEIFENLNGGISFVEDSKKSTDGRYSLGTYFSDSMGRYIELYYGSFVELYGEMDDELFAQRLKNTLNHELTHHIENMAGDRSLERWDERQSELCGFNGIKVNSVLFVCDDNILSYIAEAVFNGNKADFCDNISAFSAGIKKAEKMPEKLMKLCRELDIELPEHEPTQISKELLAQYDVALCMTLNQADELSELYQELDERVMCLADEDIELPALSIGRKKCIKRLYDEVLAVIDELIMEDE